MRSPSRTPEPNQLLTFVVLAILGLIMWGITAYVWYQAYLWFEWVTWPTALLTLAALPVPFLAYRMFTGATGLPTPREAQAAPAEAASAPASAPRRGTSPVDDWLIWLGNGEPHRGTLVLLVFLFWSILYWNLPGVNFNALTFAAWGLLTIVALVIIRFFFRPSREVSAASDTKSRAK